MATIDQTRVPKTRRISIAANKLFFSPNCKGVKAKLKIRLRIKGKTIIKAISFFQPIKNTFPNEMAIKIYRNVHTGPKSQPGGDHEGLIRVEYQLYVLFITSFLSKVYISPNSKYSCGYGISGKYFFTENVSYNTSNRCKTWCLRFKRSLINMSKHFKDEAEFRLYANQYGIPEYHVVGPALAPGSELFVGREREIALAIELIKTGKSVLIWGDKRSGKSSLLNQITYHAPNSLPNFYFSNPNDLRFLIGWDDSDNGDEIIKHKIEIIIQGALPDKDCLKYVFVFDESSEIWVLSRLVNLTKIIAEVLSATPEQIVFLLAGHQSIESMRNKMLEKELLLPRKKISNLLIKLRRIFSKRQRQFSIPDWYPKDEIYLEPIVPKEFLIDREVN